MIVVNRLALHRHIAIAAGIAQRRTTLPILNNILISANGKLTVTATDLTIAYSAQIPCDADIVTELALPARTLLDAVGSMTGAELRIDVDTVNAELRAGKSRFKIGGLNPKDFPSKIDTSALTFETVQMSQLRAAVKAVTCANDAKSNNPALQGICIASDGTALASDGQCCAVAARDFKLSKTVHAPVDGVQHMLRAFEHHDTVSIAITGYEMVAMTDGIVVGVKLLDTPFPEALVRGFIRPKNRTEAVFKREALMETFKRVGLMSNAEHGLPIDCDLHDDSMTLSTIGATAEDEIACEHGGDEKFRVAAKLMLRALDAMDTEEIRLGVDGDHFVALHVSPVGQPGQHVMIMPMTR